MKPCLFIDVSFHPSPKIAMDARRYLVVLHLEVFNERVSLWWSWFTITKNSILYIVIGNIGFLIGKSTRCKWPQNFINAPLYGRILSFKCPQGLLIWYEQKSEYLLLIQVGALYIKSWEWILCTTSVRMPSTEHCFKFILGELLI